MRYPQYVSILHIRAIYNDSFDANSGSKVRVCMHMRQTSQEDFDGGAGSVLWAVKSPPQANSDPVLDTALSSAWCLCGAKSGSGMALQDLASKPFALPAVSHLS